jgi:hypothetical protein
MENLKLISFKITNYKDFLIITNLMKKIILN